MKWKTTKFPCVRFREHESRKHGVQKDRYFSIYYQLNGKRVEEGVGWASHGWTAQKAAGELAKLKENQRTGKGPQSLTETRELEEQKRSEMASLLKEQEKAGITFAEFFEKTYEPTLDATKAQGSAKAERILFANWIDPTIGKRPFRDIQPIHIEKIKHQMLKMDKSHRTIEYTFAVIRQVWNMARRDGLTDRDTPTRDVKKPKIDNKRVRFLTHEEAGRLLDNLAVRSQQLHNMALMSLHTGMRAKEVFTLKWSAVDLENNQIYLTHAKAGSRMVHITEQVKEMILGMDIGGPNDLVFQNRNGSPIKQISKSFERAVNELGLNDNVSDKRQKVLFHTLRHTYASWLVQQGEPLYTVQQLMGHASIAMTERYSHLAPDNLKSAVRNFEKTLNNKQEDKGKVITLNNMGFKKKGGNI